VKYKHGFIGNSSSASYYIRRGYTASKNQVLSSDSGDDTAVAALSADGYVTNSYYSWHPKTTGFMNSSMVIPVVNGDEGFTGVTRFSFRFYGLVRKDHGAALVNQETAFNREHALFTDGNVFWATNYNYTVYTTDAYSLNPGVTWSLSRGDSRLVRSGGDGSTDGFDLKVNWTGSALRITGSHAQRTGDSTMSVAGGIIGFSVAQDEFNESP